MAKRQIALLLAFFLVLTYDLVSFLKQRRVEPVLVPLGRLRSAPRRGADSQPAPPAEGARGGGGGSGGGAATSARGRFTAARLEGLVQAPPGPGSEPPPAAFPLPAPADFSAQVPTPFSLARHCSQAPRAPLSGGSACNSSAASALRSEQAVAQRLAFGAACASLHPYSIPMGPAPLRHREALAEHGAALNIGIMQWAAALGLPMPQHQVSLGYTGPFIEDHFREAFFWPVRRPITRAEAAAREEAVQALLAPSAAAAAAKSQPTWAQQRALGLGTTLVLVTCPSPAAPAAACEERSYNSSAQLPPPAGGSGGAAAASSEQLYLQTPYDSELFHPFVPLFVPWEAASVFDQVLRAASRVGGNLERALATYERVLQRWQAAAAANKTKARAPVKPTLEPYAAALQAYPHAYQLRLGDVLPRLQALLAALMRKDVYYVTVCQRPAGPWMEAMTKVVIRPLLGATLVLSSGGSGHVALPLLARELPLLPVAGSAAAAAGAAGAAGAAALPAPLANGGTDAARAAEAAQQALLQALLQRNVTVPAPGDARYALSFYGNLRSGARERASLVARTHLGPRYHLNRSSTEPLAWVPDFVHTRLAFAPRGVGATSFRLYEALQLGVPPVYVFDGLYPWLPYAHPAVLPAGALHKNITVPLRFTSYPAVLPPPPASPPLWASLGYVLSEEALRASLRNHTSTALPELSEDSPRERDSAWWAKRAAIERSRSSHFTYAGVVAHIARWLRDPYGEGVELFCAHGVPPEWGAFGLAPPLPSPKPRATRGGNATAARAGGPAPRRP